MGRRERDSDHRRHAYQDHHHLARRQDADTTPQMIEKNRRETVTTTGAGRGEIEIIKCSQKGMIGIETEKGGMIEEKGTDPPQEAGADRPHHPVRALIPPFGVGEAKMIGTLNQTDGRPTKSRRLESKKQAEVINILQHRL